MKSPIENQKQLFATSNLEAERFIVNTPTQNMVNNSSLIGVKNEPVIPTYDTHIAEKCMEIADSSSTHKIVEQQQQIQTDEPIQTENCDEMNDASFSAGERSAAVDEDEDDDVVPPNESFINFISTTAISKSLKDPLNSSLAQFITEERSILDEETLMDDIQDLLQTMLSTMEIPDDHAIYITSSPTTHNLPDGGSSILQSSINNLTAAEMKFSNVAEEKTDLMDSNDYAEVSDVPVFMHKSTIVLDQSLTDDENDRICEMNATLENLVHEMQSRSLIEYDETDNDVDINIRTNHNQQQQQTSSQIEKFINRSQQINYYDENNNDEDIVAAAHLLLTLSKPQKRNNNTVLELPPCVYDKTLSDSLYASLETMFSNDTGLSQSIYTTMNQNILDRLGKSKTCSSDDDGDDDSEEEEDNDLYGTACSEQTNDGVATTTTTSSTSSLPFQDFVDIEKTATIDHEVANTHIHDDSKSTNSEMSEMNTIEEEHFGIDAQMIKDTLTNFLKYERNVVLPIVIRTDDSITNNNNVSNSAQANFNDDETVATIKVQSHWRGYKIRQRNEIEQHQIVKILDKIRSRSRSQSASLSTQKSLRDRTMDIVNAYNNSDTPCNILTVLRLLNDIEPIISVCIEIRFLIAQQGLLHLFYLFLRFCNRSEPSAALLTKILSVLKYFTVNKDLVMTLINKIDYINHYRTLLLKYYAADNMVFDQICDLLMAIIKHDNARQILSNSQMFNQTIEYVYKKLYKRAELEKQKQKQKQQQRSTPKTPRISCSMNMSMNSMFLTPIRKITVITVAQKNLKKYETFLRSFYAHK
ncbi:unnamed protein product [Didymodactylos carnosus]|uniref:Uncharacterized protein n=1 Tax=Didymodactylos carnosus TaxID=1234261 RepID=A0A813UAN1_9BILA|nr:unnamed protein product [Didymodactylos carnosus]CAF0825022.1 unnamed protein product [Didymodactylos carnosus]CAF3521186.1 unnamed protein product [Didymodactylos carnosus]CAF3611723.1 unnamed protein product [Didymodactylos carnosus]